MHKFYFKVDEAHYKTYFRWSGKFFKFALDIPEILKKSKKKVSSICKESFELFTIYFKYFYKYSKFLGGSELWVHRISLFYSSVHKFQLKPLT